MLVVPKRDNSPRRIIDFSLLNKYFKHLAEATLNTNRMATAVPVPGPGQEIFFSCLNAWNGMWLNTTASWKSCWKRRSKTRSPSSDASPTQQKERIGTNQPGGDVSMILSSGVQASSKAFFKRQDTYHFAASKGLSSIPRSLK